MRVDVAVYTFANRRSMPDKPRLRRSQQSNHAPIQPNEHNRPGYQELIGIGVLVAAIVVLLWSDSLILLALGAALVAMLLIGSVLLMLRHHSR